MGEFDAGGDGCQGDDQGRRRAVDFRSIRRSTRPSFGSIVGSGAARPAIPGGTKARFGGEGLWIACCDGIARVDAATGKKLLSVPLDGAYALAEGSVWTLSDEGVQRIDPETGASLGTPVGAIDPESCRSLKDMAVAFGSAWLACKEGKVVRIDLSNGDLTTISTALGAHTFARTDDAIWVTNYQAGSVSRIDPKTNRVTTIEGAGGGVGITSGGGFIWAATRLGIAKIDPATATILGTVKLGSGQYYELVWDDGVIWASTRTSLVLKVDPSTAEP